MVDDLGARVLRWQVCPVTAPLDDARVADDERAVGEVRQMLGSIGHHGRSGDVEDVAAVGGGHGAPSGVGLPVHAYGMSCGNRATSTQKMMTEMA